MKEQTKSKKRTPYIVAIVILSLALIALGVMYAVSRNNNAMYQSSLESIYQKNFYELVDNINNTEIKLNKVLNSKSNSYKSKMLKEISKNANDAQCNLNMLPYSINGLSETISFVNQVSGYTETLAKNLDNGENLGVKNQETLADVYDVVVQIKQSLNTMSKQMWEGYSISQSSLKLDGEYNLLTKDMARMGGNDIDYPTMIYDGPFSDSQINKDIKGLNFKEIDQNFAKNQLNKYNFEFSADDFEYLGESDGLFQTYNFYVDNGENNIYVQITKKGGKLLTLSSNSINEGENLSIEEASKTAEDYAKKIGLINMKTVWSDSLNGSAYINLAPIENGIIIYPDLVKVKVDLADGRILGFEATSYYMNHIPRNLGKAQITNSQARDMVNSSLNIQEERLALIPIEYSNEVLCYEFVCNASGDRYYVYINAITGAEENILKVVETDNGNLLM